jgi:hypothetical protein
MPEQITLRTTVSCLVALILIVGFAAAPAAAFAQDSDMDDGIDMDTTESDGSSTSGVQVRIVNTNSPVQTGDTLKVTVDVESDDGGTAELFIDGESVDQKGFAPGQEDRVVFEWDTSFTDAGEHEATVRSGADSDSETVDVEPGYTFPEERCTNVPKQANDNVPYDTLPSQDQLPDQVPNPIPPFITPESIANLVVGVAPNQCDIQDPNDPSVDPNDPPSTPGAEVHVLRAEQYKDGGALWVTYRAGLSDDGPAVSGTLAGLAYSGGVSTEDDVVLDDGEKEYVVEPRFQGDDSTADGSADASSPIGAAGATVECSGGECQPGATGVPNFVGYPAIPAPIWDGEE